MKCPEGSKAVTQSQCPECNKAIAVTQSQCPECNKAVTQYQSQCPQCVVVLNDVFLLYIFTSVVSKQRTASKVETCTHLP